ncbi:hypothetical protein [Shewanella marisflavi]|uniref:hypothetical protein n=1 Tax=Shewanella marisflavi TaxID=260364 RepID=UPI003AAF4796
MLKLFKEFYITDAWSEFARQQLWLLTISIVLSYFCVLYGVFSPNESSLLILRVAAINHLFGVIGLLTNPNRKGR